MADLLNQRRAAVSQAIDQFTETWHGPLHHYIQAENHVPNLQVAINRLDLMINLLSDPAVFAGGVAVEVLDEEEMDEIRAVAVQSVIHIRNLVPVIQNHINGENNIHRLQNTVDHLDFIIEDLIASVLP